MSWKQDTSRRWSFRYEKDRVSIVLVRPTPEVKSTKYRVKLMVYGNQIHAEFFDADDLQKAQEEAVIKGAEFVERLMKNLNDLRGMAGGAINKKAVKEAMGV